MTELIKPKNPVRTFFKSLLHLQVKRFHKLPYVTKYSVTPMDEIKLTLINDKYTVEEIWQFKKESELPTELKVLDQTFTVDKKNLFRNYDFNPFEMLYRKINKLQTRYEILFHVKKGVAEPVELKDNAKINGYTLFVASHANVYKRALGELMQKKFGEVGKYLLYIGIVVAVIVVAVIAYPMIVHNVANNAVNNATVTPTPVIIR